jgi:hypothetical protein
MDKRSLIAVFIIVQVVINTKVSKFVQSLVASRSLFLCRKCPKFSVELRQAIGKEMR